jgi:hypothetical protein
LAETNEVYLEGDDAAYYGTVREYGTCPYVQRITGAFSENENQDHGVDVVLEYAKYDDVQYIEHMQNRNQENRKAKE